MGEVNEIAEILGGNILTLRKKAGKIAQCFQFSAFSPKNSYSQTNIVD